MKHSDVFGDIDPLIFDLLGKFMDIEKTTIINDPPKISMPIDPDILTKYKFENIDGKY